MELEAKIEALLFYKGEPMETKKLASILSASSEAITEALLELEQSLQGRGISLLRKENEVTLSTHPSLGPLIETMRKDELSKELSKATLETLSIIIYKQGSTRSEIDYIRGVNSSFILRNLLIRGLIQKESHPTDSRKYFYKPTFELMGFLGIQKLEDLPDYDMLAQALGKEAKEEGIESPEETSLS